MLDCAVVKSVCLYVNEIRDQVNMYSDCKLVRGTVECGVEVELQS